MLCSDISSVHDFTYHSFVTSGTVANGTLQVSLSAATASALVELTHGTPKSLVPSHMITAGAVPFPHGEVTVKFLKTMFSHTASGLVLQVMRATARPYFPDV